MAVATHRAFLAALPEYRQRVTKLTFSQTLPQNTEIGVEICENVFFNEDTGVVFVLVVEEEVEPEQSEEVEPEIELSLSQLEEKLEEEKSELAAGQTGPQGVIR